VARDEVGPPGPLGEAALTSLTVVPTIAGPVRGVRQDGLDVFRGIPYGAPPVGERRFAPPSSPEPWTDPLDATTFGPAAPQGGAGLDQVLGGADAAWDEDCLRLNVWTPRCDDARRPVMVWIHGGAFLFGSGHVPWYDGANLARRDAVIVTINYRLGAFGYLHLEGLDPRYGGSGNAGLLDQVAALAWVQDNIAGFGGDPDNVTVWGESAGAMSVGALLGTPAAEGLFRRAILQSGAASNVHRPESATRVAAQVVDAAGGIDRLRTMSAAELLAVQEDISTRPLEMGLAFQPVVDGTVLPEHPLDRIRAGRTAGVDVLLGTNTDEMTMFLLLDPQLAALDEAGLRARIDETFVPSGALPGEALACYRRRLAEAPVGDVWCAVLTDQSFRIPAVRLAEAQAARGGRCWMYEFAYPTPVAGGILRATHALEIPFVWDNLGAEGAALFVGAVDDGLRSLSTSLADAWVAFARNGEPSAEGLPTWPRYDGEQRRTLRIGAGPATVVADPNGAERALWDHVVG